MGGDRCGIFQPEREWLVYTRRLARLHRHAQRQWHLHGQPLVQPGRCQRDRPHDRACHRGAAGMRGQRCARRICSSARAEHIATLVLSKSPFTPAQLKILNDEVELWVSTCCWRQTSRRNPPYWLNMIPSKDIAGLNGGAAPCLDLTVPTDNRPFFFNQLRFTKSRKPRDLPAGGTAPESSREIWWPRQCCSSSCSFPSSRSYARILLLRSAAKNRSRALIAAGSAYFSLIGMGFMLAEISLLQYLQRLSRTPHLFAGRLSFQPDPCHRARQPCFGPPQYRPPRGMLIWGLLVVIYLLCLQQWLTEHIPCDDGARAAGAHFHLAGSGCPPGSSFLALPSLRE